MQRDVRFIQRDRRLHRGIDMGGSLTVGSRGSRLYAEQMQMPTDSIGRKIRGGKWYCVQYVPTDTICSLCNKYFHFSGHHCTCVDMFLED